MAGFRVVCVQEELFILTAGFREIRHGRYFVGNTEVLLYAGSEVAMKYNNIVFASRLVFRLSSDNNYFPLCVSLISVYLCLTSCV